MLAKGSGECMAQEGPSGLRETRARTPSAPEIRLNETLKIGIIEAKGLPPRCSGPIQVTLTMDREIIKHSSSAAKSKSSNCYFNDEFTIQLPKFHQLSFSVRDRSSRTARPFARLSFRKNDVIEQKGIPHWFPLKPYNSQSDVTGKICVDVQRVEGENSVQIKVLDYSELRIDGSRVELYALITPLIGGQRLKSERLRIPTKKHSSPPSTSYSSESSGPGPSSTNSLLSDPPSITINISPAVNNCQSGSSTCSHSPPPNCKPQLRVCIWHDILGGLQSYFHGEVKIPLDLEIQSPSSSKKMHAPWYFLKPRSSDAHRTDLGSLHVRLNYTADVLLPIDNYKELFDLITNSVPGGPKYTVFDRFLPIPLLELCHIEDMEELATPLVKILLHTNKLRPMIKALAAQKIMHCQDPNSLFRSSSLSSKLVNVLMRFVGHEYLLITLKECIDKIYSDKLNCEIDPSKLPEGADLDKNRQNLLRYAELVFSRIVDSNHRCPQLLKDVMSDLRDVTRSIFPSKIDQIYLQRLVLNNFIMLRFFGAAITSPKRFNLKRDNPTPNVQRTMTLISKILVKHSNNVVNESVNDTKLQEKEAWLTPVLSHFNKESHKLAVTKFLDRISCVGGENSISGDSVSVIKEGTLTQRLPRQKRCLELSWMTTRRRYCCLTETELYLGKSKGEDILDRLVLRDISECSVVNESIFKCKHVMQVSTTHNTIYLNAADAVECNEWVEAINRQARRQVQANAVAQYPYDDLDIEKEMEAMHMNIIYQVETLRHWKGYLEGTFEISNDYPQLPNYIIDNPEYRAMVINSLNNILGCAFTLERAHRHSVRRVLDHMNYGSKELPIGDDNYLLLKARIDPKEGIFAGLFSELPSTP